MYIKIKCCLHGSMSQNLRQGFCVKPLLNPAAGELVTEGMDLYVWYLAFFQKGRIPSLDCAGFHTIFRTCQEKASAIFL